MKELPQHSFPPESFPKKAARFVLKKAIHTFPASVLLFAACSGGSAAEKNNNQELKDKESSGYALPFPEGETWFLTNGPHADGWSKGIKYAIDIAPPELGRLNGNCPIDDSNVLINNRVVTASASGEVVIKGDDRNRNNLDHSVIHIKNKNGLTQVYMHLDETKVKLGDRVKQGDPLGNPSCEYPPGGANTGPHVHVGLMKDGQPIPIDGIKIGGWTIRNGVDGKDGTMTKPGEKTRTADVGRYADPNGAIRNDLPNNSNRAVVASPKDPIPPISGKATSKEVFTATPSPTPTAIPTPKPTETPKPAAEKKVSFSKKPDELYRALLTSPIPNGMLPQNVTLKGKSAGKLDETPQAFKAVGQVNIIVQVDNLSLGLGSGIIYTIFPDKLRAKSVYDAVVSSSNDKHEVEDSAYPTTVSAQFFLPLVTTTLSMQVENVNISIIVSSSSTLTSSGGDTAAKQEYEVINLAKAAVEHLKKVGQ